MWSNLKVIYLQDLQKHATQRDALRRALSKRVCSGSGIFRSSLSRAAKYGPDRNLLDHRLYYTNIACKYINRMSIMQRHCNELES